MTDKLISKTLAAAADLVDNSGPHRGDPVGALEAAASVIAEDDSSPHAAAMGMLAADLAEGPLQRSIKGEIRAWARLVPPSDQAKRMRRVARQVERRRRTGRAGRR